jgi:hypothetical protein
MFVGKKVENRANSHITISLLKPPGKKQTDIGTEFPIDRTLLEDRKAIYISITEFRTQGGVFKPNHLASIHCDTPILYWKSHLINDSHCILARIAVRVFETIANSVAWEERSQQ